MQQTIVLKRLSASDLTIFEHQYTNTEGAKQKGINLDKAVIYKLYPNLKNRLATSGAKIPVQLLIYGPESAGLHSQMRKILLQAKNVRLNGELIRNPPGEDKRYDSLEKGDFSIIEFNGDNEPESAKMLLLSKNSAKDRGLYQKLSDRYSEGFNSRRGMQILVPAELSELMGTLDLPSGHPAYDFLDGDALEDAALGGIEGIHELQRRRKARGVSQEELSRAKHRAEQNGRLGEELLNSWLEEQVSAGNITGFKWEADENAVAPYDFRILDDNGSPARSIDAKSTSGIFTNKIHISSAELEEIVCGTIPYDIYRLYGITDTRASCRIAENVRKALESTFNLLSSLPDGISANGITVNPDIFSFSEEFEIDLAEADEVQQNE
ncbi:hypothetical protein [Thiolapillus sp.]